MDLRHLEYFVAVAEELSFTRAAARLHVVQSGVSATIRALEQQLRAELFERGPHRIALTDAGTALLPEARAVLDAAQGARDAVAQVRGGLRGTVHLGAMTSVTILDLPGLLGRFTADHPGVTVRMRAAPSGSAGLAQALLDGEFDLAFLSDIDRPPAGLSITTLARVRMVAIVPASWPGDAVTLAALAERPFIDSPAGFGNRVVVDRAYAAAGLRRRVALEVVEIGTAPEYVRHGLGVSIMPAFSVPADHPGLKGLPIDGPELWWTLSVATATRRRPTAATRTFLELAADYVRIG
ncbi:LysR family transcriptional regulator [Catenuloplanes atrovinosus]|uniref:DNA-binding transcriptional LysR family regulator n=1 Tax=Catenuloplanes atrovinosus TaxID=137266 RepID=A0AAE4CC18_9ACTN|nr:LysR family transcriptional regulator [Catenuloplanes atrovinosus]MDR7278712.1 DNA-binding transcriptional LysR family regulator [Catenuloplanes atrovinosus]